MKASCPMRLERFPMDIQRCPLEVGSCELLFSFPAAADDRPTDAFARSIRSPFSLSFPSFLRLLRLEFLIARLSHSFVQLICFCFHLTVNIFLVTVGYSSRDVLYKWNPKRTVFIASDMRMSQFDLRSFHTGNVTGLIRTGMNVTVSRYACNHPSSLSCRWGTTCPSCT